MKAYSIEKAENKLTIKFFFEKKGLLFPLLLSAIILSLLLYALKLLTFNLTNVICFSIVILVSIYATFNSYFEWIKNKLNVLEVYDDGLHINGKFFLPTNQIKHVYIEYCSSHYESGWTIYLENYLGNKKHIIKKQLTKKNANEVGTIISEYLNISIFKSD